MAFTSHGHHIDGTVFTQSQRPPVARCGGPGICDTCSREAGMYRKRAAANYAPESFQELACIRVFVYALGHVVDGDVDFRLEDVFVVMASYVLGNWKCLVSTTVPDGMYYEVTYNAAKNETYLDAYKKVENVCYKEVG